MRARSPAALAVVVAACAPAVVAPRAGDDAASAPPIASASTSTSASAPPATSTSTSAAPSTSAPPVRPATVAWAVTPLDHASDLRLSVDRDGVLVSGDNEFGVTTKHQMVVLRLRDDGTLDWSHPHDVGFGRRVRRSGDATYFLAEAFSRSTAYDAFALAPKGGTDMVIARLQDHGDLDWAEVFSTVSYDRGNDLVVLPDGGVVVALGAFVSPKDGSFRVAGGEDALVARYDARGRRRWITGWEFPGYDEIQSLVPTGDGSIVVAGTRWTSADQWESALASNESRLWIAKLDADGKKGFERELGASATHVQVVRAVGAPNGDLVVAGGILIATSLGSVALDPANGKGFVAVLDPQGDVRWARTLPPVTCVATGSGGRVYAVTKDDVFAVEASSATSVLHVSTGDGTLADCAMAPGDRLYVSGKAAPRTKFGDRELGAPLATHAPKWLRVYEDAFVARLDL